MKVVLPAINHPRINKLGFGPDYIRRSGALPTHTVTLPDSATTNLVVGNILTDVGIIVTYSATRGALHQIGTFEITCPWTDYVETPPTHESDVDIIGLTATADFSGNDVRLNLIVDNSSADDVVFNYVVSPVKGSKSAIDWDSWFLTRTPSGLTITLLSDISNKLDWTVNGTGFTGYQIWRSDEGGAYSLIDLVLGADTATYTDNSAIAGMLYYYKIRAYFGTHYSAFTSAVNNLSGDITTGLVLKCELDENAGSTATDSSGSGTNGTITGADWTLGWNNSGLSFDGVSGNDSVKFGDILDSVITGANKKFTMAMRVKRVAIGVFHGLIYKVDSTAGQRSYLFRLTDDNKLQFFWYGALDGSSTFGYKGSTNIIDTTKWYHVAVTYDGTLALANRVCLYVDAVLETLTTSTTGSPSAIPDGTANFCLGAQMNVAGTTSVNNLNGKLDCVNVFSVVKTNADIKKLKYAFTPTPAETSVLYSYDAGAQKDVFLDTLYTDYRSVGYQRSKPAKSDLNPIFPISGANNATWDRDKHYPCVIKIGATYYMWYTTIGADGVSLYTCKATSADGIIWTKPNLGLITYGGNTNNNIIRAPSGEYASPSDGGRGRSSIAIIYQPLASADLRYLMTLASQGDSNDDWVGSKLLVYKSADGNSFTQIKTQALTGTPYCECDDIITRADGRYIAYYVLNGLTDARCIGAWLSNTSDPTGTWVDQGVIISTSVATNQKYRIGVELINGIYYGVLTGYNSTTEHNWIDLYTSRNGLTDWTLKYRGWVPLGASGSWEDGMILGGKYFLTEGNDWRMYYAGSPLNHNEAAPRDTRIGIATIGYQRIGGISGTGNLITTAFTPTTPLLINADMTNGTLKVELLAAADNSVIAGYSKDDMDALSGDTYSTEVTWGGNSILTDRSLKIKFYLT